MQITAATFTDPAMRSQLQQYYKNKKSEIIDAVNAREPMPEEVKYTAPDGTVQTGKLIHLSGEQMANAMVSFDKWVELQQESFDTESFGQKQFAQAQQRVDQLAKQGSKANSDDVASAQESFTSAQAVHTQWQKNMNEIQTFLLGLQEAA